MMNILENGVALAVLANAVVGATLVWDKVLLKETNTQSVVNYVFWLGAISVFGCIVGLFGMRKPALEMLLVAGSAGAVDLLASCAYYKALQLGEASQTLAVMGGFAPLATALIGIPLLHEQLHGLAIWGFSLLVAGGFFMFSSQKVNVRKILPLILLAAGLFGLANVTQKLAFNALGFVTGFVFFSIGQFICALCFLVRRRWRDEIFKGSKAAQPRSKAGYFANRFFNGVGAFLLAFAISKAHPAMVSALAGVRYATIFIGVYLLTKYKPKWLKEVFTGWTLTAKIVATALVIAGLAVISVGGNAGASGASAFLLRDGEPTASLQAEPRAADTTPIADLPGAPRDMRLLTCPLRMKSLGLSVEAGEQRKIVETERLRYPQDYEFTSGLHPRSYRRAMLTAFDPNRFRRFEQRRVFAYELGTNIPSCKGSRASCFFSRLSLVLPHELQQHIAKSVEKVLRSIPPGYEPIGFDHKRRLSRRQPRLTASL